MSEKLYYNTSIGPEEILKELIYESTLHDNYYLSPARPPVLRSDVSKEIRKYLEKFIKVPFYDCGFLKTLPNSTYPLHIDGFRICALNMLISDSDINFETFVVSTNEYNKIQKFIVPYVQNKFTILNVMKPHGVFNRSPDQNRIILSIGIKAYDYNSVLKLFLENKLF
jgi:hypothetical protein